MKDAKKEYNAEWAKYLKFGNEPNTEVYNACKEKFREIKSIIEKELNPTESINEAYHEAWILEISSDANALKLNQETKEELSELDQKIKAINTNLDQLLTKKTNLTLPASLIRYIDEFKKTWDTNQSELLAGAHYNYAEFLVGKSELENALAYFEKATNFYEKSAKTASEPNKSKFLGFAYGTKLRMTIIKASLDNNNSQNFKKIPKIHLQRVPNSTAAPSWQITNGTTLFQASIESRTTPKIKRKSNEELTYPETKRSKKDSSSQNKKALEDKILAQIPKAPIPPAFLPEFFFKFSETFVNMDKNSVETKIYWLLMAKLLKAKLMPNDINEFEEKIDTLIKLTTTPPSYEAIKQRLKDYLDIALSPSEKLDADKSLRNFLLGEIKLYCEELLKFSLPAHPSIFKEGNLLNNNSNLTKESGEIMYLTRNS